MLSYSDILIPTTKAVLIAYIASYPDRVPRAVYRAYVYTNSIDSIFLTVVYTGIIFLVAELQPQV